MSKRNMRKKTKIILQFAYIFGTLLVIFFLGFTDQGFRDLGRNLKDFNMYWLSCGLLAMAGYWLIQTHLLNNIAGFVESKIKFKQMLKIFAIGEYYSAITPFATGGQPVQIAYFKRYGVGIAKSTSVLLIRFFGFVASMCVYYIVMMAFRGNFYLEKYTAIFWVTFAGFFINLAAIIFITAIIINKNLVERIGFFVIRKISKWKIFKRFTHMHEKYEKGVEEFASAATFIKAHRLRFFGVMFESLASVFCMFSVSYFVYRSTGLNEYTIIDLMSMQIFLYLAVSFFPTPGAIGASEGGFNLFFASIFTSKFIYLAMLLWRFFTYYSNLIIGGIIIVCDEISAMRKNRKLSKNGQPQPAESLIE